MEGTRKGWCNPKSDKYYTILYFSLFFSVGLPLLVFWTPYVWWKAVVVILSLVVTSFLLSPKLGKLFVKHFFKNRFGFKPSSLSGMELAEQVVVDQTLHDLAAELYECDKIESEVQGPLSIVSSTVKGLKKREEKLRAARQGVRRTKKAFWDAHMLAESLKYEVRSRYSDYLVKS